MSFIEIQGVNKHYGSVQALHDVSLQIPRGAFVTLLGPSGSGKTTLLKILSGFEGITSGRILLNGRDITNLKPEKRNFGLVFQGYALFPHMSVFDNIAYSLKVRRYGRREVETKVGSMLELVQLEGFADRRPSALSGGQQQRVALARALVFEPDLLLLDEPMSALDKKLRVELQDQLRDIHERLGTTFVNVTHDQEEAMHMSDSIAVMNHGRVEQYDTPVKLYRMPQTHFVAEFIGKSNIFSGRLALNGGSPKFIGESFELPLPNNVVDRREEESVILVIRPEDTSLLDRDKAGRPGHLTLRGTVASSTYSGDRALYNVRLPCGRTVLSYRGSRDGILATGSRVAVSLDAQNSMILPAPIHEPNDKR